MTDPSLTGDRPDLAGPGTVQVPELLEDVLSPEWLTAALGSRYPGIEVTAVSPGPVISRVATNARFSVECAGGLPAGLPAELCAKGYYSEAGRVARHAGEPEACFYRDIVPVAPVRTLRCVYAGFDSRTSDSVVLTEDIVAQGAVFLDPFSGYTADQAAESLAELAVLHAATWQTPALEGVGWLAPRLVSYLDRRGIDVMRLNLDGPIGAGVPAEVRDAQVLASTYRVMAEAISDSSPWSVIHGDPHVGNVFLDSAGRPSFLDWQLSQRAPWYIDVGYHIASALTAADRRPAERDLLRHYLDQLAAAGGEVPSWDEAWRGFRRGILYGYFLWSLTLKVDPTVTSVLLERLGTAAADHDVYSAVPA